MKNALSYEDLRLVVSEQQDEIDHLKKQNLIERDKTKELTQVIDKSWIKVIIGIRRCGGLVHLSGQGRLSGLSLFSPDL